MRDKFRYPPRRTYSPSLAYPPSCCRRNSTRRRICRGSITGTKEACWRRSVSRVNAKFSKQALKKYDRAFDAVTWVIAAAHVAALALLIARVIPGWAFVVIMVVTRTALAGSGHYHLHRKWKQRAAGRCTLPFGKALFDINYVGTSLIGTDGHVLLHHPYLGSGADVKKTFFDGMLRLHPVLRIPGYTLHKLGICLTGLPLRGQGDHEVRAAQADPAEPARHSSRDPIRADFWIIRAWIVVEFALCLATGHIVAWLVQFFLTLWFNTFLVVASHDFEEPNSEEELAVIPEPLRDDWAAQADLPELRPERGRQPLDRPFPQRRPEPPPRPPRPAVPGLRLRQPRLGGCGQRGVRRGRHQPGSVPGT